MWILLCKTRGLDFYQSLFRLLKCVEVAYFYALNERGLWDFHKITLDKLFQPFHDVIIILFQLLLKSENIAQET